MKDVVALCQRVVIIAQGELKYDGSLSGIIDQFSQHKLVTLQLADGQATDDFSRFGEVVSNDAPRVQLRIPRDEVSRVISAMLTSWKIDDLAVEDPPMEELIAKFFSQITVDRTGTSASEDSSGVA